MRAAISCTEVLLLSIRKIPNSLNDLQGKPNPSSKWPVAVSLFTRWCSNRCVRDLSDLNYCPPNPCPGKLWMVIPRQISTRAK
jgi:hypothetical protein